MNQVRIKLTGQLPDDLKPTTLAVFPAYQSVELNSEANEYIAAFPEAQILAEWGYFKPEISVAKRIALSKLMGSLTAPLKKFNLSTSKF